MKRWSTKTCKCVRADLGCADICAIVDLSRHMGCDANRTRAVPQACITCRPGCGEECAQHAETHDNCGICTDACPSCGDACKLLLDSLG